MPKGEHLKGKKHPASGMKKGKKIKKTIQKLQNQEEARKKHFELISPFLSKLAIAQIIAALGCYSIYLVLVDETTKKKKFELVTDDEVILSVLENPAFQRGDEMIQDYNGADYYYIIKKESFDSFSLNKAIDRLIGEEKKTEAENKNIQIIINSNVE